MARQLNIVSGDNTVQGGWVRVEGAFKRGVPMRISAVGTITGSPLIIEELIAGIPGNGTHSPYAPQLDTGTVVLVGTIAAPGADLLIENPIAFIRARADANFAGALTYVGAEMLE